jgi:hypothetical protein
MFYTIHRCIKLVCWCAVLLAGWKLYENREVFEPAVIWYDVWDNGGLRVAQPKSIAGRAENVIGSQTFVLATRGQKRFNVRLMGLKGPSEDRSLEAFAKEQARREALQKMIQGNWVHLEISYQNMNNLGGIAFLGPTNVNAELVRMGVAMVDKVSVKGLPKESQYALLWASRHQFANK